MNLENFPTSESAKRMLESVDSGGFYDKSYVGKWIFQVMGLEMDEARQFIEELPYQAFPETATWGLRYHEQKYGLPVREGMPYEERRRNIYSKRDERSPMNPYRMEVILENITGRKAHVDDESGPVNTFTVKLESGDNVVDVAAAIKKLKEIKQSHVAFTLSFTSLARIEICGRTQKWKNQYTMRNSSDGKHRTPDYRGRSTDRADSGRIQNCISNGGKFRRSRSIPEDQHRVESHRWRCYH